MKDGLWGLVNGTEELPVQEEAQRKHLIKRDCALAIIVLSVDPTLLYIFGDPQDPAVVWKKLEDQFQKRSWANKLALRRKLYSLKLKDNQPVQTHIKEMTEIFEGLAV